MRSMTDEDLPSVVKSTERGFKPARFMCEAWSLTRERSAVLASSTAQERGAPLRFAPFGVTFAARGALRLDRPGRRDGGCGRTKGWSGGKNRFGGSMLRIEEDLAVQQRAGDPE
jgi:hypothetical protein